MMNYHSTIDFYNSEDNPEQICDPINFKLQYYSRMLIILVSFLSSGLIGFTCLISRKRSFWTFKILMFQSLFECTDLGLAFVYNIKFIKSETLESQCNLIGYIMHASWVSSFCCCFLIIYQMRLLLKVDNFYETLSKHIIKIIILIGICSYLWLLVPFILHGFVPTGWKPFNNVCKQYFFCGFKQSWIIYLIFWTLPQVIIFGIGIFLAKKNQKLASIHLSTFQDQEFQIIQDLQVFPIIYGSAWLFNQIVRYVDLFESFVLFTVSNDWTYALYVLINLIFELHLVIVLYYFYTNYKKVLNINQLWKSIFCCQKKVEIKDKESLLYQDLNGTQ